MNYTDYDDPMSPDPSPIHHTHSPLPGLTTPAQTPQPLSETAFHRKAQLVAESLLDRVTHKHSGKIKDGIDPVRVEKALSTARQVIESIRKARATLKKAHEDQKFEQAVIAATTALPETYRTLFLETLQDHLTGLEAYNS